MATGWRDRLLAVDGVTESPSMFSERPGLWVNGTEIAHEDADGRYDVRLTRLVIRQMRDGLRADPRVRLRASSSADWVEVEVSDSAGQRLLVELVRVAADTHRPPPGTTPLPPPQGAALARRRRLH